MTDQPCLTFGPPPDAPAWCPEPSPPAPVLPVFNPLSYDGGRCQVCQSEPQRWCLACYSKSGAALPNRFVCGGCLAGAEAEAKCAGARVERFGVRMPDED